MTTNLWIDWLVRQSARTGLEHLGLDTVDLYLIHWPAPTTDAHLDAWRGMEDLAEAGLARTVGVSNFLPDHLNRLVGLGGTIPTVNQIELHPALQNRETVAANPASGSQPKRRSPSPRVPSEPHCRHRRGREARVSTPQVVLRWHIQHGHIVIPKFVTPRITSNVDVFEFQLDEDEIEAINALDRDGRTGPHPAQFND